MLAQWYVQFSQDKSLILNQVAWCCQCASCPDDGTASICRDMSSILPPHLGWFGNLPQPKANTQSLISIIETVSLTNMFRKQQDDLLTTSPTHRSWSRRALCVRLAAFNTGYIWLTSKKRPVKWDIHDLLIRSLPFPLRPPSWKTIRCVRARSKYGGREAMQRRRAARFIGTERGRISLYSQWDPGRWNAPTIALYGGIG